MTQKSEQAHAVLAPSAAELTLNQLRSMKGSMPAMTAPRPMKKLCIAKPMPRCSSGSLSATKARNGSIEMLIEASSTQSRPAAM